VRRFSANKSKARQATSRMKLIDKLKPEDVKPSSRQYPWIRFEVDAKEKLHRLACEVDKIGFAYPGMDRAVIDRFSIAIEAGERVAIVGENGVGKSTLIKLLAGEALGGLKPQHGAVKWAEKARPGYFAQDHAAEFAGTENLTDWIAEYARIGAAASGEEVETLIRGTLGRLLFSGDEVKKPVNVVSGGEQGRLLFGRLMLARPNVLLMDEPTNHLDMESIESLNGALEKYPGTLIFVSHDREFVDSLATRVLEIRLDGKIVDYRGGYEQYLASQGLE